MVDIKINGQTYSGLTALEVAKADGTGNLSLSDAPQPVGTITITSNGTHDVANYASAIVNVGGMPQDSTYLDGIINRTLTSIVNNRVTTIGAYAFSNCGSLTSINFPLVTSIESYAFNGCTNLDPLNFPLVTSIGNFTFKSCTSITTINLPLVTSIGNSAFSGCSALSSVVIGTNSSVTVCSGGSSMFNSTPIKTGTGYIYVADSLVDSYKAESNWSTYANQIKGISEMPT